MAKERRGGGGYEVTVAVHVTGLIGKGKYALKSAAQFNWGPRITVKRRGQFTSINPNLVSSVHTVIAFRSGWAGRKWSIGS